RIKRKIYPDRTLSNINQMQDGTERCRIRWAVDVEAEMEHGRFHQYLRLLPANDQEQVLRFLQPIDQQRALASRLLQRCSVCHALGVPWSAVTLSLTKGRKPFTTN
ncbi:hypothetical protein Agub_g8775, partial [Astrephomene gubernaculifera]